MDGHIIIYAMEMFLFRNQRNVFNLTKKSWMSTTKICSFCGFLITQIWSVYLQQPKYPVMNEFKNFETINPELPEAP